MWGLMWWWWWWESEFLLLGLIIWRCTSVAEDGSCPVNVDYVSKRSCDRPGSLIRQGFKLQWLGQPGKKH